MGLFIPDYMCETIYDIPKSFFVENGVKHIFLDIDNTLVSYDTPLPTEENIKWLDGLRMNGISVYFVSNNYEQRVKTFASGIGLEYIADAHKPLTGAYKKLMLDKGIDKNEVCAVGDQIFTDVLAAKLIGAKAVKVSPVKAVENTFFKVKRFFEVPFVKYYYYTHRNK